MLLPTTLLPQAATYTPRCRCSPLAAQSACLAGTGGGGALLLMSQKLSTTCIARWVGGWVGAAGELQYPNACPALPAWRAALSPAPDLLRPLTRRPAPSTPPAQGVVHMDIKSRCVWGVGWGQCQFKLNVHRACMPFGFSSNAEEGRALRGSGVEQTCGAAGLMSSAGELQQPNPASLPVPSQQQCSAHRWRDCQAGRCRLGAAADQNLPLRSAPCGHVCLVSWA